MVKQSETVGYNVGLSDALRFTLLKYTLLAPLYECYHQYQRIASSLGKPHRTVDSILASRPTAPSSNLSVSKIFSEINYSLRDFSLLDVAELIDSKDSAIKLNKLIKPIQYWWEQYCKKKKVSGPGNVAMSLRTSRKTFHLVRGRWPNVTMRLVNLACSQSHK